MTTLFRHFLQIILSVYHNRKKPVFYNKKTLNINNKTLFYGKKLNH